VTRRKWHVSNIKARPLSNFSGASSAAEAREKVGASGPWGAPIECSDAPPGWKPTFASYAPHTMPMNSAMQLRWYQGGRNVCSATIQRGGKITKSAVARPGTRPEGTVSTVKMEGSGWSKDTVPIVLKRVRSYLYGLTVPCHATTSKGECGCAAANTWPPNFTCVVKAAARSSKAATGYSKSRALASPLEPSGPSSGSWKCAPNTSST